jgi:hypothetical protein
MAGGIDFMGCDPEATAASLVLLARDLRDLADGKQPDVDRLRDAPVLRSWSFDLRPRPCLKGRVYDHPVIVSGRMAATSEIYALDPGRRWVRTMSRFYELGPATLHGM